MTQPESTPSKPASDSSAHEMEEAHPGLAVGRLRGAFHLGALLPFHLLGWAWAGTVRLTVAIANGAGDATDRDGGGDADR